MKGKRTKRLLTALLAMLMVFTFMPQMTAPVYADNGTPAIQIVNNGTAANIEGAQVSSVWFGNYKQSSDGSSGFNVDPIKWRVLSNADKKLFLLSDQNLDYRKYNENSTYITWQSSTLSKWLRGIGDYADNSFVGDAFSSGERSVVGYVSLLSIGEVQNNNYGFTDDQTRKSTNTDYTKAQFTGFYIDTQWWLIDRIDVAGNYGAAVVYDSGSIDTEYGVALNYKNAVRPTFDLNLESVLFTSAATGGKTSIVKSADALEVIPERTDTTTINEWKLTIHDASRDKDEQENPLFKAEAGKNAVTVVEPGYQSWSIPITWSGAKTGDNEYVSVILCDGNDNALYYGHISKNNAGENQNLNIPTGLASGSYKLHIFNEQINGDKQTDYSSAFNTINLKVKQDPGLKLSASNIKFGETENITASIPNDAKGTVEFTVKDSKGQTKGSETVDVQSGSARMTLSGLDAGNYKVIANYSGDSNYSTTTKEATFSVTSVSVPAVSGIPFTTLTASGNNGMTVKWQKTDGADGYDIFFAKCGGNRSVENVKTIEGNSTFEWTIAGLEAHTPYKALVKAYVINGNEKQYVASSPLMHAYTSNSTKKYTNAKSLSVKKKSVSIKKGKKSKIKAKLRKMKKGKKIMPSSHVRRVRYLSTNTSIATVTKKGTIKAKSKGTCYVYAYAHNGVFKKIKVTVK